MGLQTEFPILVCDLATGTDAIIGTDVLGSVLPHTLDIKNGLLFTEGGASLQLHRRDSALSGRVFTVGHCSIRPYSEAMLHCSVWTTGGRHMPSSGLLEGLTLFAENTGLIVGMESSGPRIKFQSGCRRGGSILRGGNDSSSLCYSVHYGATPPAPGWYWFASCSPSWLTGSDISGSWHYTTASSRGCSTALFGLVSYPGVDSHRSYWCSGARNWHWW